MPVRRLKEFLDERGIRYVTVSHSRAFTAQEIAAAAHVPGKELAKSVMVKIDGRMAMAVLPAPRKVDLRRLKAVAQADDVELADEDEFRQTFPECEVGAMPPFGNLYDMQVFVDENLAEDEEISFNAGSHTELMRLSYKDFERLVQPKVAKISTGA